MDAYGHEAEALKRILTPMVKMIVAEIAPKKDTISISQAYKDYGRRWIDHHKSVGNITPIYKDSGRVLISVSECELLLAAEKEKPRIIIR